MEGQQSLVEFLKVAGREGYDDDIQDLVEVALQKLNKLRGQQFRIHQSEIERLLRVNFSERLAGKEARIRELLSQDELVLHAVELLGNMKSYEQVLATRK